MKALATVLAEARAIWGDRRMTLIEVAIATVVVSGDICREARRESEGGEADMAEVAKELGNLMLSAPRWADDLGLSIDECIDRALAAQREYVRRRGVDHA